MALADDIRMGREYANTGVHAFLLLGRTMFELLEPANNMVRARGITPAQFNVLRILRGSPRGLPCTEISRRMVSKDSDVTRLLDKLIRDGLAERTRSETDRRVVIGRITQAGMRVCRALDKPLGELHENQFKQLGGAKTRRLIALLEELRAANAKGKNDE